MNVDNLRYYCWVHSHLTPIQKGIQAQHAAVDLLINSEKSIVEGSHWVKAWAQHFKTTILLDGGRSDRMADIVEILKNAKIPYEAFREPDMENMLTAVGCVLPRRLFDAGEGPSWSNTNGTVSSYVLESPHEVISVTTDWHIFNLLNMLTTSKLAI